MPDTVTAVGLTVKTIPSTVIISAPPVASGAASGAIVVLGKMRPLGPAVIVCPPMTTTEVGAPGPMRRVVPEMMAWVGERSKGREARVVPRKV